MSPSLVDMFSPLYVTERVLAEVGTTATLGEVQTTKVAMAAELEKSRKAKINITNSRKTEGRPNTLDRKADAESSNTSNSSSSSSSRSSSTNPSAQPSSSSKNSSTELAKTSPRAGSLDLELELKHPLENAWTLWFFKNDKARTWEENQRPIITVTTVEDFWALYNHIEVASRLPPGSDYSLFKVLLMSVMIMPPPSRRESSLTGRTPGTLPEVAGLSMSTGEAGPGLADHWLAGRLSDH